MADQKLPAKLASENAISRTEKTDSFVARGLAAIRHGNGQELSLLSDEKLDELFGSYLKRDDYENALRILSVLEDRGSGLVEELCEVLISEALPSCIRHGDEDNGAKEFARAESCQNSITKAAERGFALAQDMLGELYCFGTWAEEGSPEDNAEAAKWSRKAAEQGKKVSQENLALMYYLGKKGLPQDYAQAMKWFDRAAEQGSLSAQFKIGEMNYSGHGVRQNFTEAMKAYRKIGDRRDGNDDYGLRVDAQYKIAEMYYKGEGTSKDYVQAYMWLTILLQLSPFDSKASKLRNELTTKMTPGEIVEAQRLALAGAQST